MSAHRLDTLRLASVFGAGLVFALGLGLSGMTQPDKVVGFLDITGDWKPELMFVMGGAIAVHLIAYLVVPRLKKPLFEPRFSVPTRKDVTFRLIAGSLLFGAGWGLAGYCPGPALVSSVSGSRDVLMFVVAMLGGMVLVNVIDTVRARARSTSAEGSGGEASAPTAQPGSAS